MMRRGFHALLLNAFWSPVLCSLPYALVLGVPWVLAHFRPNPLAIETVVRWTTESCFFASSGSARPIVVTSSLVLSGLFTFFANGLVGSIPARKMLNLFVLSLLKTIAVNLLFLGSMVGTSMLTWAHVSGCAGSYVRHLDVVSYSVRLGVTGSSSGFLAILVVYVVGILVLATVDCLVVGTGRRVRCEIRT